MNLNHLMSLLQDDYVTVEVAFSVKGVVSSNTFTYKAPKAFNLATGDKVIVDSPTNGLTVVTVVNVHQYGDINIDAPFDYKWIVQKVDTSGYHERLNREKEFMDALRDAEVLRRRQMAKKIFVESLGEGTEARKAFEDALFKLRGTPQVEG